MTESCFQGLENSGNPLIRAPLINRFLAIPNVHVCILSTHIIALAIKYFFHSPSFDELSLAYGTVHPGIQL